MDNYFCLKCEDSTGLPRYIDIPNGRCEGGVQLVASQYLHAGENQQWKWSGEQIVSMMLSPSFCLAVKEVKDGSPVFLFKEDHGNKSHKRWVLEDGTIKLKDDKNFCIGLNDDNIVLKDVNDNDIQWEFQCVGLHSQPATSCYLSYRPVPKLDISNSWTLENTVCVRRSANATYICVIGWGPGGCAGIQQINEDHTIVIFSYLNTDERRVEITKLAEGVQINNLDGEGVGLKATKDVDWKIDQKVNFQVSGMKCNEDNMTIWRCSCWYKVGNNDTAFLMTFKVKGENNPFNQHIYAFIEDLDRSYNCEGHSWLRTAEFSNAQLISLKDKTLNFNKVIFTKQQHGGSKISQVKAFGAVVSSPPCFVLSTGGYSESAVRRCLLLEKYEQCTNKHLSMLSV